MLESYNRNEFLTRMSLIQLEIHNVKDRLEINAESIDEVIDLLEYIETLKQDDNKIDDIQVMIDKLAVKMEYIERLEIIFRDG